MLYDWWIWICFICLVFQGLLLWDRPVSSNNRLVKFAPQIFLIFLFLSLARVKQHLSSSLYKKSPHHRDFLCFSLSSLESFSTKLGEHYIVICINHTFSKMTDGTEYSKSLLSLYYAQHDTTDFAVIYRIYSTISRAIFTQIKTEVN